MKTVKLIEEIPSDGVVEEKHLAKHFLKNPLTIRGNGRYYVDLETIEAKDLLDLKEAGYAWFWSNKYLKGMSAHFIPLGWRITSLGIQMLIDKGYRVEIDTLEMQKERSEKAEEERKEKARMEREQREKDEAEYKAAIAEYEKWLGNPEWTTDAGNRIGRGRNILLKTIQMNNSNTNVLYEISTSYALTSAGYIAVCQYYSIDFIKFFYSIDPAPQHVVEEAQRIDPEIFAEQKRQKEIEERKKHVLYYHLCCPRCEYEFYCKVDVTREKIFYCFFCHAGKGATAETTVLMKKIGVIQRQHIPWWADIED